MKVQQLFRYIILSFSVLLISMLLGCVRKHTNQVRIAYLPSSSCLPLFVAVEKGFFKEANIEVELLRFGSTNDALNTVLADRADGTPGFGISSFCAIDAKAQGALKIYLPCVEDSIEYANNLLVLKDSPINSIDQLAGKKVGTFTSSTQTLYLKLIMNEALPKGKSWEIIQVDDKLQIQALVAKQYDALFAIEPLGTKAVHDGIARVLVKNPRGKFLFSPFPAGANCFSSKFISNNPQLAANTANVFIKAVKYIRSNPQQARSILPKYALIDSTIAQSVGLYTWWLPTEENWAAIQRVSDLLSNENLISRTVDIRNIIYEVRK